MGGRGSSSATSKTADKKPERVKAQFVAIVHEKGKESTHIQKVDEFYKTKNQLASDLRGNGFVVDDILTPQEIDEIYNGTSNRYETDYATASVSTMQRNRNMRQLIQDIVGNFGIDELIYLGERNYL